LEVRRLPPESDAGSRGTHGRGRRGRRAHDAHARDGHAGRGIAAGEAVAAARQPGDEMHRVAARRHSGGETADDLPHPARVLVVRAVDGDAQGVPFVSRSERTRGRCKAGPHSRNGA